MGHRTRRLLLAACTITSIGPIGIALAGPAQAATTAGNLIVTVKDYTGTPLAGANIAGSTDGQTWYLAGTTGADGSYNFRSVRPGDYKLRIQAPGGLIQYAPGQTSADSATAYPVVSGQTTSVNDQLLPSGNVQISLLDRVSGAPVTPACVRIATSNRLCDHPDGRYSFTGVLTGTQPIVVDATKTAWPATTSMPVSAGPADFTVQLEPAAAIRTSVQATDDPSVHPPLCVYAVYPGVNGALNLHCENDASTGNLLIGPLASTAVQLFAVPTDTGSPVYGAQWVGAAGGTGDQRQAAKVNTTLGTVTTIPPIRLDHAGSISGTIDDPYYGESGTNAWVRPFGLQDGLRSFGYPGTLTDYPYVGRSYQLTGLGPYAWPVEFAGDRGAYADQWSGNAPNRYTATPVQVRAGGISTLNVTMTYATGGVTGEIRVASSTPAGQFWVSAKNAITGDDMGGGPVQGSTFGIGGLNTDPVVLTAGIIGGPTCTAQFRTPTQGPDSKNVVLTFPTASSCGPLVPPRVIPPALTSKPVVAYHPGARRTEVLANAGGALLEQSWNPTTGLSGPNNLGGNITGTPSVIYNPRNGTIEVYARSTSNHLVEKYWVNGWSGWIDLGGDVAGDPTAIYNPRNGTIEVYARTSTNHVAEKYWYTSWSNWTDLGGDVVGDPSVIYDPSYGTAEIYTRTSTNRVAEKYWANGWSGWIDLGGNLTDEPTASYNPITANTNIYVNADGYLDQKYWSNTDGWSTWINITP